MRKRHFLFTALGAAAAPAFAKRRPASEKTAGPALLTLTGDTVKSNRGAFDPALDQMMHKQGLHFERAYAFDFDALTALPAVEIAPTLEYDARRHALRGPLVVDVIAAATEKRLPATALVKLRAVDGYVVQIALADLRKYKFIVATHLDGRPMPLGGLGPLWAVYDADRFPEMLERPLPARFTQCPWALYHAELIGDEARKEPA